MSKKSQTQVASDGQIELTAANTPLYEASENLVKTRASVMGTKKRLEEAEHVWVEEMKAAKQKKINHKGDLIQLVEGRTTEDHARFVKA